MRNGGTALRYLLVTAGLVAYGYWATGRAPFGASAYVAVGIPIGLATAAALVVGMVVAHVPQDRL